MMRVTSLLTRGIWIRIPGLHVSGMALWPFVLHREEARSASLLLHERIHLRQQLEMGVLPFYLWYVAEYAFYRVFKKMKHHAAYRALLHEREAYRHDTEPGYLEKRRAYAWLRSLGVDGCQLR